MNGEENCNKNTKKSRNSIKLKFFFRFNFFFILNNIASKKIRIEKKIVLLFMVWLYFFRREINKNRIKPTTK